ncbi:hypothetical protein [Pedobacter boryungensis]|uniref:Lipoprotein n=1 Tax=Pedobacter boryungensis TaxID=869962 RepID=A0ABX2DE06_9SPHI|nr:hypothetical protein [Pedobacter boryungensis]NQX32277.1 hypothetical protein [Pedobacter boryungensis]
MKEKPIKTTLIEKMKYKNILFCTFMCIVISSCNSSTPDTKPESQPDTVLRLSDIPRFDTTGKQSIYREVSPYEVKGIDPPEREKDKLYEEYNRPYSHFEFIEKAYSNLSSMGYKVGSIVEFSYNLLQDTVWAKKVFFELDKHCTKTYLGTERAFLDSIKNANNILIKLKNDPQNTLRKKTRREYLNK